MVSDPGVPVPWQGRSQHATVGSGRPQAGKGAALLQVLGTSWPQWSTLGVRNDSARKMDGWEQPQLVRAMVSWVFFSSRCSAGKGALAQSCASRQNTKCHVDDAVGVREKEEKNHSSSLRSQPSWRNLKY